MSNQTVSVIMPTYRCRETVVQAVASVCAQTYADWELWVVDDACPEQSWQALHDLVKQDTRIRIIHHEHNLGVAQARNSGIFAAQGRYIAFLDADDYWLPEKLSSQIELLQAGASVVCSDYWREKNGVRHRVRTPSNITYPMLLCSNHIGNLTGIYDREQLGVVGQKEIGHEDYVMWLQLVRKAGRVKSIQIPLAVYRVQENSLSGSKGRAAGWQWKIYREELGFNLVQASVYFLCYILHALWKRI